MTAINTETESGIITVPRFDEAEVAFFRLVAIGDLVAVDRAAEVINNAAPAAEPVFASGIYHLGPVATAVIATDLALEACCPNISPRRRRLAGVVSGLLTNYGLLETGQEAANAWREGRQLVLNFLHHQGLPETGRDSLAMAAAIGSGLVWSVYHQRRQERLNET